MNRLFHICFFEQLGIRVSLGMGLGVLTTRHYGVQHRDGRRAGRASRGRAARQSAQGAPVEARCGTALHDAIQRNTARHGAAKSMRRRASQTRHSAARGCQINAAQRVTNATQRGAGLPNQCGAARHKHDTNTTQRGIGLPIEVAQLPIECGTADTAQRDTTRHSAAHAARHSSA